MLTLPHYNYNIINAQIPKWGKKPRRCNIDPARLSHQCVFIQDHVRQMNFLTLIPHSFLDLPYHASEKDCRSPALRASYLETLGTPELLILLSEAHRCSGKFCTETYHFTYFCNNNTVQSILFGSLVRLEED